MTVLIFANGVIKQSDWIYPYLDQASVIIAADGGLEHLRMLDITPDVLIGDLDSVSAETSKELPSWETLVIDRPQDKDETDLELALLYAVSHYTEKIQIFGALGGRLDQTIGNVLLLAHPDLHGLDIEIVERGLRAWIVKSQTIIIGNPGDVISLIPLTDDVLLQETSGLRWDLKEEQLVFGFSRGISNVLSSGTASITVRSGKLLCIHMHS